jgi:hypothetical protein
MNGPIAQGELHGETLRHRSKDEEGKNTMPLLESSWLS